MIKQLRYIVVFILLQFSAINMSAQVSMPDTVCIGATKLYQVNNKNIPSTYTWKIDGITQAIITNEISITWKTFGTFLLTVQEHSAGGCDGDIQSGIVYVYTPTQAIRYPTINAKPNVPQQLTARTFSSNDNYLWSPSFGLSNYFIKNPIFKYDKSVEYLIRINSGTGCSVVDTVYVKVTPVSNQIEIFVPAAFSPNGDGHNDVLTPILSNIKELKYFKIFNRWGQLLFQTNIPGKGWDGRFKELPQDPNIFSWFAEGIGNDGNIVTKKGITTLIR